MRRFISQVLGIAAGLLLYRVAQHYWGWLGVVALVAILAALYFAADAAIERRK